MGPAKNVTVPRVGRVNGTKNIRGSDPATARGNLGGKSRGADGLPVWARPGSPR